MTKNERLIGLLKSAVTVEQKCIEINTITSSASVSYEKNIKLFGMAIEALSTQDPRIESVMLDAQAYRDGYNENSAEAICFNSMYHKLKQIAESDSE